ncbi:MULTISPECIES: YqaA family protein [Ferrimonas]|uniref:YqaA family protein n=1 Tax=Ferrimonas TaxID=44011 RepID=UPI000422F557|nr:MULTISPECIES: VTT domain-containing protein [Ferrimonas]USD38538.1 DedA family protein [Ferrimonas sp. SCSIO 43195]
MVTAFWSLFASAFISATLAPGGSELLLAYWVQHTPEPWLAFVLVATIGNTLGSLTSFLLGYLASRRKSPASLLDDKHQWLIPKVRQYGVWSLLLAWLPVVGDAIPLLAGWFRFSLLSSSLLIFVGKFFRYLVIALTTLGVVSSI